jgi:predicted nuclease of predicted toxin-antitoxin system
MEQHIPGLIVALYTDEDVTSDLAPALRRRGYQAQSTVEAGNDAFSDEAQLTYAAKSGMAILTHNIRDFVPLARTWFLANREHSGIVLSEQFNHNQFGELLRRVLRLLNRWTANDLRNQVLFLQQFK